MKVGVSITCTTCRKTKKPVGRSAPLGANLCDHTCPGYWNDPKPGSLWWGESEKEFGYQVSADGTGEVEP